MHFENGYMNVTDCIKRNLKPSTLEDRDAMQSISEQIYPNNDDINALK